VPPRRSGKQPRLQGYSAKRDFTATPEPAPGSAASPAEAPRFVIHEHHARRLHWDLRLERDGALASWALPKGLPEAPKENRFAAHTEDHPLEYLDFEGQIPKGQYGAGKMTIWDRGTYECLKWESGKVEVALHGERVSARYALFGLEKESDAKDWMIHRMDPPADPDREPMPQHIVPMLARAGELPPEEARWAYEIKWDGVRAIAYSTPGELRLESRNLNEITDKYPELAGLGRALGSRSAVLDGEIVAFDGAGRPSFSRLQQRMQLTTRAQARRVMAATPVTYMIFDLLWLDGHSLMELDYAERRRRLAGLELAGESWQTPENVLEQGHALLQASVEQGLEGILAKRLDSTYQPGLRPRSWIKIKTVGRQEFVVGGWLAGQGKRRERIGALLLGVYEADGALRYVGRVGSGFSDGELDRLGGLLAGAERSRSPFAAGPRPPRAAVFAEPRLVAEVEFTEWTNDGNLRHPVYKGLREDKDPRQVVREGSDGPHVAALRSEGEHDLGAGIAIESESGGGAIARVQGRELKLSNLEKVLYPERGFTKRELIDYYVALAPVLLGHLEGRALTVTRWPDGVQGKSFFQKQAPAHRPQWVRTVTIESSSKPIDYTLAEDLPTLVWLANLAAIELHTPLARAEAIERPTALVFDLDPGAPASIVECCAVALQLHGMFENLGLASFAKTSGSKGLQVYVPLNRADISYADTKPFARTVAELLESADPDLVVSRMTKARRTGKVLIDWSQNDAKKTTVCVYSLRATERPTASTPLEWDEVRATRESADPGSLVFEAPAVIERVAEKGDLFAPVLSMVQELPSF
jgi:bifunctional non-homologous end joining protein LigD